MKPINTNADFQNMLSAIYGDARTVLTEMDTAINGMEGTEAVKARLNEALAKMPPLEQIENAQRAAYALNALGSAMEWIKDCQTRINQICAEVKNNMATMAGLDAKVNLAINGKVEAGELITKEAHELAISTVKGGFAQRDARRTALAKNGFNVIDTLLALNDADFEAKQTAALTRKGKLAEKKITLAAEELDHALFSMDDTSFNLFLKSATPAPSAAPKPGDPLFGGNGTPPPATPPAAKRFAVPC
jgi:hypothetical protein